MRRWGLAAALIAMVATPVWADVTITSTISGKGGLPTGDAQTTTYIKGTKWRSDTTLGGQPTSVVLDTGARQMIVLNHKRQEAEIHDLARLQADIRKSTASVEAKAEMTPTGQTRQILGQRCAEYTLTIVADIPMGDSAVKMVLRGPVWIARNAPGARDYAAFYRAAAQGGLFFENPQQTRMPAAQAKGRAEMYRLLAEAGGVPYLQELQISFEGSGMMAGMMNKMGGMAMTMTVTGISTGPIPDDLFTVPEGYNTRGK